jgi:hypothetical protein
MPTSRNARGIDIIIYSQDGKRKHTIQLKSLQKRLGVPLGNNLGNLIADFLVICWNLSATPEIFVTKPEEIIPHVIKRNKEGKRSYWLSYDI